MQNASRGRFKPTTVALFVVFALSAFLKWLNVGVGAPYVTIDDGTTFQSAFLVWFGKSPPQHVFLEGWICGVSCLSTYVAKLVAAGEVGRLGVNLIADAYQDFYGSPDTYVLTYRYLMLLVDLMTALFVFLLAKTTLRDRWNGWAAVLVVGMYLFSYNTFWCDVVARPDGLATLFATGGLYMYCRSSHASRQGTFWVAAALFGVASGLKLHAAHFLVLVALDLVRMRGLAQGAKAAVPFLAIGALFFAVAAGTPLYDPLMYAKMRMLNIRDDASPWIQWGDQFLVILKGSGWIVAPLAVCALWMSRMRKLGGSNPTLSSVIFIAGGWLILFCTVRVLRAYWMLPALPVLFISAVFCLTEIRQRVLSYSLALLGMAVLSWQSSAQVRAFANTDYGEYRSWVRSNVGPSEPIYIYGFETLELPRSVVCVEKTRKGIERQISIDESKGLPFVEHHLKNWEEETQLVLFRLLGGGIEQGYTYYSYYSHPLDAQSSSIRRGDMTYLVVQRGFELEDRTEVEAYLTEQFDFRVELTGPGGGGKGLAYRIYERKGR